jgi:hypothetical protein
LPGPAPLTFFPDAPYVRIEGITPHPDLSLNGIPNLMLPHEIEQLRNKLRELTLEHQDLDDVINHLSLDPGFDQIKLRRLKKRKLLLKDQIAVLRSKLIPDIEA